MNSQKLIPMWEWVSRTKWQCVRSWRPVMERYVFSNNSLENWGYRCIASLQAQLNCAKIVPKGPAIKAQGMMHMMIMKWTTATLPFAGLPLSGNNIYTDHLESHQKQLLYGFWKLCTYQCQAPSLPSGALGGFGRRLEAGADLGFQSRGGNCLRLL